MKQASVLLQIALLIGGVVAIYFYVYPEFTNVNENQNLIQEYNEAISEATKLQEKITRLQQRINDIPDADMTALERYLPTEVVDEVSVQRDINAYVQARGLILQDLAGSEDSRIVSDNNAVEQKRFFVTVLGDYERIKALIADLERNDYPLRLVNLTLASDETGLLQADLEVETYRFVDLPGNT